MKSKRNPGHLDEAHELAEQDMRRQPLINRSKPLEDDDLPSFDWPKGLGFIAGAVVFVAGGLKLAGVW